MAYDVGLDVHSKACSLGTELGWTKLLTAVASEGELRPYVE